MSDKTELAACVAAIAERLGMDALDISELISIAADRRVPGAAEERARWEQDSP